MRFRKPLVDETKSVLQRIVSLDDSNFIVPSLTVQNKVYHVDMTLAMCDCVIGMNGAPCKHQYLLWSSRMATSPNFLPIFSPSDRERLAKMATNSSLPTEMYEGIHDRNLALPMPVDNIEYQQQIDRSIDFDTDDNITEDDFVIDTSKCEAEKQKALQALQQTYERLKKNIDLGDSSYLKSLVVLDSQTAKLSQGQLTSALMMFGKVSYKSKTAKTLLKKAQKHKISVQPTAQSRWKVDCTGVKNGTKRALALGRSTSIIPTKPITGKRTHKFCENVDSVQKSGSTHQALMISKSKVRCSRSSQKKAKLEKI